MEIEAISAPTPSFDKKRTFGSSELSLEVKIESASSVPHRGYNNNNNHF